MDIPKVESASASVSAAGLQRRRLSILAVLALALLGGVAEARAEVLAWTSTAVRGTVITLVGDRWEEVARGQVFAGTALRTLRSGRVTMTMGDLTLELGPGSAVELGAPNAKGVASIRHYL